MSTDTEIDPDGLYAIGVAARVLGWSQASVRALEQRGEIQSTRTPRGHRRFLGAELLRLRQAAVDRAAPVKPEPIASSNAAAAEETKARAVWLGQVIARAQREVLGDTAPEIRVRLGVDLERALRHWGPASPTNDVEPLVASMIERAKRQAQKVEEEAARRERKGELIEDALAHVQQRIDRLPKQLVGPARSLKRQNTKALLRARLRDQLQQRLRGDEDEDQVHALADEFLAEWIAEQGPDSLVPNTLKLLAVGATGFVSGATAATALSPALRARAAKLKAPLLSWAGNLLKRFSVPPPPASPPPPPADQAAPAPRPFRPGVGVAGWPSSYPRTSRYFRRVTHKSPKAARGNVTPSEGQVWDVAPPNTGAVPPESPQPLIMRTPGISQAVDG